MFVGMYVYMHVRGVNGCMEGHIYTDMPTYILHRRAILYDARCTFMGVYGVFKLIRSVLIWICKDMLSLLDVTLVRCGSASSRADSCPSCDLLQVRIMSVIGSWCRAQLAVMVYII